jgi:hypothetical protein
MFAFSTPMIVLVVVCFNTTLFLSLASYLYRQRSAAANLGQGSQGA